ncbi:MAG TPA: sigma-70 family RNA polymerase sigma factor [Ilumatobacteraceae bacterium]|nr:sigma-70 family RNA polymerase sigma factor [Ilumatobacteraceae bacterium]
MITNQPGTRCRPDQPDDLEQLLRSYHTDRRAECRDRIAESFEWLVMRCANKERWHDEPIEDLAQVARIGLLQAIERFDPDRGVTLHTFAEATMVGTIHHYHRSALQLKVPRPVQEMNVTCKNAVERLTASLKRVPTTAEVAEHVGLGRAEVADALAVDHLFHPMSLSSSDDNDTMLESYLGENDLGLESIPNRAEIHKALTSLPSRQRTILFLHFYEASTQAEIGAHLGLSQVQVSRLMTAALDTLRHRVSPPDGSNQTNPSRRLRHRRTQAEVVRARRPA